MLLVQGLSRQPLVSTGAGNTAPGDDDNHLDGKSGGDLDDGVGDEDDDDHQKVMITTKSKVSGSQSGVNRALK